MANRRVMVIGGGLAGLAASMKLAELDVDVGLMSLTPVKRSHSACAQGGINSVNDLTRQLGDAEWKHFDDTVYGGDFLQHQPPVKELAYWAPQIIDLMDRLGVTFNRTLEGFRDQRRFGGTLYKRTAFAGATTGQQLLYALDEQVRRWEVAGKIVKLEGWDFLGPILDVVIAEELANVIDGRGIHGASPLVVSRAVDVSRIHVLLIARFPSVVKPRPRYPMSFSS